MKTRLHYLLAVSALLSACVAGDEPYVPVADTQELMATVVEPAADFYWDAVGWIVDSTGTTQLRPESPEEWDLVRNAAFVVAESGNLLMMQGRAVDEDAWRAFSEQMITVGQKAIETAEARDELGVFDVGAELYAVCTGCHATYAVEVLRPNATLVEGD